MEIEGLTVRDAITRVAPFGRISEKRELCVPVTCKITKNERSRISITYGESLDIFPKVTLSLNKEKLKLISTCNVNRARAIVSYVIEKLDREYLRSRTWQRFPRNDI